MTLNAPIATRRSRGFTLAELVVVLLIVAATAGIATVLVVGKAPQAREDVVKASFSQIQAAIYGRDGQRGYFEDLGYPPHRLVDLLQQPSSDDDYNPLTRKGWNGPYLVSNARIPTAGTPEFTDLQTRGYAQPSAAADHYYLANEPCVLDPFGRPYVLYPAFDPTDPDERPTHVAWGGVDGDLSTISDPNSPLKQKLIP